MKAAEHWSREEDRIRCGLCPHRCLMAEGQVGICHVRTVLDGELKTLVYGMATALNVDPIEKKPLFHFLPGTRSLSIATVGCNLSCNFCQNWSLSQYPGLHDGRITGEHRAPEAIVKYALEHHCQSISFTYSEPTIFYEYAKDTASEGMLKGLSNVFVTNGFIEQEPLLELKGILHGANVDIKAFREDTYRKTMGGKLQPVLDAVVMMKRDMGVWVEVTTLVIPTMNDSEEEMRDIARFIVTELGEDTPWHVSRFHPDYEMSYLQPTPPDTLKKAREIGMEEGLLFVYTGNLPGDPGETTYCPSCGYPVVRRIGFAVTRMSVEDGNCRKCETPIAGVWV